MKKTLTIGSPCEEDWNKMTPNQEGRHCDVCDKTVVDLTQKTQPEMVAIFESKGGDMCGRMWMPKAAKVTGGPLPVLHGRLRQFALALLVALGILPMTALKVQAQGKPVPGKMAYRAEHDLTVNVYADGKQAMAAQVLVKQGNVVVKQAETDASGMVTLADLAPGQYTVVVRYQSQKAATREVHLGQNMTESFFLTSDNGKWSEERIMMLGDTIGYEYQWDPQPAVEERETVKGEVQALPQYEEVTLTTGTMIQVEEYEVTAGVPEIVEEQDVFMGQPVVCNGKKGGAQSAEAMAPQPGLEVKVFPNPMDGLFRAEITGTHKGEGVSLLVFDAEGRLLRQSSHEGGEDLLLEVDLSREAAGIYFVKVVHGAVALERRVVRM